MLGPEPEGQLILDHALSHPKSWRVTLPEGTVTRKYVTWKEAIDVALEINKLAVERGHRRFKCRVHRIRGAPYGRS